MTLAAATAGCAQEHPDDDGKRLTRHIAVHGDTVVARTRWGKPAMITADGSLTIDGRTLPLDTAQRRLVQRYHAHTTMLYNDAVVLAALPPERTGPSSSRATDTPRGEAITVAPDGTFSEPRLRTLCTRIGELESIQDALAEITPQFRPHATIPAGTGERCAAVFPA